MDLFNFFDAIANAELLKAGVSFTTPHIAALYNIFNFKRNLSFKADAAQIQRSHESRENEKERLFTAEENQKMILAAFERLHQRFLLKKENEVFKSFVKKMEALSPFPIIYELERFFEGDINLGIFFIKSDEDNKDVYHRAWHSVFTNVQKYIYDFYNAYYTKRKLYFSEHVIDLNEGMKSHVQGARQVLHSLLSGLPILVFSLDVRFDPNRSDGCSRAYILEVSYSVSEFSLYEEAERYVSNEGLKTEKLISKVIRLPKDAPEKAGTELLAIETQIAAYLQLTVGCIFDVFSMSLYKDFPVYPGILIEEKRKYDQAKSSGNLEDGFYAYPVLCYQNCYETLSEYYRSFYEDNLKVSLTETDRLNGEASNKILLGYAQALSPFLARETTDRWRWEVFVSYLDTHADGASDTYVEKFYDRSEKLYRLLNKAPLSGGRDTKLKFLEEFVRRDVLNKNSDVDRNSASGEIKNALGRLFFVLGCFYDGCGDLDKAAEYFESAADLGHVKSIVNLGYIYIDKDPAKSASCFYKAAQCGDVKATDIIKSSQFARLVETLSLVKPSEPNAPGQPPDSDSGPVPEKRKAEAAQNRTMNFEAMHRAVGEAVKYAGREILLDWGRFSAAMQDMLPGFNLTERIRLEDIVRLGISRDLLKAAPTEPARKTVFSLQLKKLTDSGLAYDTATMMLISFTDALGWQFVPEQLIAQRSGAASQAGIPVSVPRPAPAQPGSGPAKPKSDAPEAGLKKAERADNPKSEEPNPGGAAKPDRKTPKPERAAQPKPEEPNPGGAPKPGRETPKPERAARPKPEEPNPGGAAKPDRKTPKPERAAKPKPEEPIDGPAPKPPSPISSFMRFLFSDWNGGSSE